MNRPDDATAMIAGGAAFVLVAAGVVVLVHRGSGAFAPFSAVFFVPLVTAIGGLTLGHGLAARYGRTDSALVMAAGYAACLLGGTVALLSLSGWLYLTRTAVGELVAHPGLYLLAAGTAIVVAALVRGTHRLLGDPVDE